MALVSGRISISGLRSLLLDGHGLKIIDYMAERYYYYYYYFYFCHVFWTVRKAWHAICTPGWGPSCPFNCSSSFCDSFSCRNSGWETKQVNINLYTLHNRILLHSYWQSRQASPSLNLSRWLPFQNCQNYHALCIIQATVDSTYSQLTSSDGILTKIFRYRDSYTFLPGAWPQVLALGQGNVAAT